MQRSGGGGVSREREHLVAAANQDAPPHAQVILPRDGNNLDIPANEPSHCAQQRKERGKEREAGRVLRFDGTVENGELVVNIVDIARKSVLNKQFRRDEIHGHHHRCRISLLQPRRGTSLFSPDPTLFQLLWSFEV